MKSKDVSISDFEKKVNKEIPIPKKWKRYILEEFKKQANFLGELEDLPDLLKSWKWIMNPSEWIWKTIRLLNSNSAASAYLLMIDYLFDENIDNSKFSRKDERRVAASLRRALHRLYNAGLVTPVHLSPEEVGYGRNSVTIWVSPWGKEKDIKKAKDFYLNLGGIPGESPRKSKKTPKEVVEFNSKVRVLSILKKFERASKLFEHYVCPKKHSEGTKAVSIPPTVYQRQKREIKCPKCGRSLDKLPYDVWEPLKYKELCEKEGIKP